MVIDKSFMYKSNQINLFPFFSHNESSIYEIPDSGKKFIILLLSFQLNFADKFKKAYYFRNAISIKNSFKVPGHLLLLPSKSSPSKGFIINEILYYVHSFIYLLESKKVLISSYQSNLLEKAYNSFLWEEF